MRKLALAVREPTAPGTCGGLWSSARTLSRASPSSFPILTSDLSVAASQDLHDTLNRLAAAEAESLTREFLAPMVRGGHVEVRIAGVICRLKVEPADDNGMSDPS